MSMSADLDRVPLTYAYKAQVQAAAQILLDALKLWEDGYVETHPLADREIAGKINVARQRIENIYVLVADGVTA